jgi:hypothetical protein
MASFVKEWAEDGSRIGGLFGAGRSSDELTLPWNRAMQVAFLIYSGRAVRKAVSASKAEWAKNLRSLEDNSLFDDDHDLAFYGKYSLLATDQGIRGLLQTTNDLCYSAADDLDLHSWDWDTVYSQRNARELAATDQGAVNLALKSLKDTEIGSFLQELGVALSTYDWRTSSTPGLTEEQRLKQAVFRGSSGYKEIRRQLMAHVAKSTGAVARTAKAIIKQVEDK